MKRSAGEEPFDIKPEVIGSSVGLVPITRLYCSMSERVGNPEVRPQVLSTGRPDLTGF